jgi:hypothetical protein
LKRKTNIPEIFKIGKSGFDMLMTKYFSFRTHTISEFNNLIFGISFIAYHSESGNTKLIAQKIQEKVGGELLEIIPRKKYFSKFALYF